MIRSSDVLELHLTELEEKVFLPVAKKAIEQGEEKGKEVWEEFLRKLPSKLFVPFLAFCKKLAKAHNSINRTDQQNAKPRRKDDEALQKLRKDFD